MTSPGYSVSLTRSSFEANSARLTPTERYRYTDHRNFLSRGFLQPRSDACVSVLRQAESRGGFEASRAGVWRTVTAQVNLRRGVASSERCLLRDARRSSDILQDLMTAALFWAVARRVAVIPYRHFGTTYRSHLQG